MDKLIITVQEDIDNSTSNFHTLGMHVALLNLRDYNNRFDTDFDLIYLKDSKGNFMFELANPPQYLHEHKIDSDINFLRTWAINYAFNNNDWFRDYYHNINSFEFQDILTWRNIDDKMYKDKRQHFIIKYKNYAPLGFLSGLENQLVKDEIDKRFLRLL